MSKNNIEKPSFSFSFSKILELKLLQYIEKNKKQEIMGGLIGDIIGKKQNQIVFEVKEFLPFPNLAENKQYYAKPPEIWFNILEAWRSFYFVRYKFIGFLHTHPEGSSKMSNEDNEFAQFLQEKYGTILFVIIGENKNFRSYVFNKEGFKIINGKLQKYRIMSK